MTNEDPRTGRAFRPWIMAFACLLALILVLLFPPGHGGRDAILIGQRREVPSRILGAPRGVNVHLPEHYGETDTRYPVLIKLFGGPEEYFAGIVGEVESLSGFAYIPDLIVVGLDQLGHEEVLPREVTPADVPVRGEEFLRFLQEELIPWIDSSYLTNGYRILLGTFDCGLFGVWAWLTSPGTFDAVLVTDPGWGRDYGPVAEWFDARYASGVCSDAFLHITEIEAPGRREDTFLQVLDPLLAAPGREHLRFERIRLIREEYDPHRSYTSCREGLLALFRGYRLTEDEFADGIEDVDAYYRGLSDRIGCPLPVPEMALVHGADALSGAGRFEEAIRVLKRLERQAPWSLNALFRLAHAYEAVGDRSNALAYYREGLERGLPPLFRLQLEALERSAASALEHELRARGPAAGRRLYERILAGRRGDLVIEEADMNAAGYRLLRAGEHDAAVLLFKMNCERFPESANAWDSLGEACLAAGQRDEAIASYRRSLELDPGNENAREVLTRLGIRP